MSDPHPGVGIHHVPAAVYHSWPLASSTLLNEMWNRSPAHALALREQERKETPALVIGAAIHVLSLEGEAEYERRYAIGGPINPKTHEPFGSDSQKFREWAADKRASGLECVTPKEDDLIRATAAAIQRHPSAMTHLRACEDRELSLIFRPYSDLDVLCKCRIDALSRSFGCIIDIKSCESASVPASVAAIEQRGYHRQGAIYLAGAEAVGIDDILEFNWCFAEKQPPNGVAMYRMNSDTLQAAVWQLRELLEVWDRCEKSGDWPGYDEGIVDVGISKWALRQTLRDRNPRSEE